MNTADKTYYEILDIDTTAKKKAIDKAYVDIKTSGTLAPADIWLVERAYGTLSDPALRKKYDAHGRPPAGGAKRSTAKRQLAAPRPSNPRRAAQLRYGVLAVSGAALAVVLLFHIWPMVAWRFTTYDAGTAVTTRSGAPFGEILEYQGSHLFPGGIRKDAYRVAVPGQGERWLTKEEINRLTKPAK